MFADTCLRLDWGRDGLHFHDSPEAVRAAFTFLTQRPHVTSGHLRLGFLSSFCHEGPMSQRRRPGKEVVRSLDCRGWQRCSCSHQTSHNQCLPEKMNLNSLNLVPLRSRLTGMMSKRGITSFRAGIANTSAGSLKVASTWLALNLSFARYMYDKADEGAADVVTS